MRPHSDVIRETSRLSLHAQEEFTLLLYNIFTLDRSQIISRGIGTPKHTTDSRGG